MKDFSKAGYGLKSRRKSIYPPNVESQVFLHINLSFWGIADVHVMFSGTCSEEEEEKVDYSNEYYTDVSINLSIEISNYGNHTSDGNEANNKN